jgi:hypothetical protein
MRRVLMVPLFLALAWACAPATDPAVRPSFAEVTLIAAPSAGGVRLTLANESSEPLGYNLCASAFQRRDGSRWIDIPTSHMCTMELRTLSPGANDSFTHEVPATLERGEYRMVTRIERPLGAGEQMGLASNSFTLP